MCVLILCCALGPIDFTPLPKAYRLDFTPPRKTSGGAANVHRESAAVIARSRSGEKRLNQPMIDLRARPADCPT
jgi:hypothetical protein